jgi:hypothetical protein
MSQNVCYRSKNIKRGQSRHRNLICSLVVMPVVKSMERENVLDFKQPTGVTQQPKSENAPRKASQVPRQPLPLQT